MHSHQNRNPLRFAGGMRKVFPKTNRAILFQWKFRKLPHLFWDNKFCVHPEKRSRFRFWCERIFNTILHLFVFTENGYYNWRLCLMHCWTADSHATKTYWTVGPILKYQQPKTYKLGERGENYNLFQETCAF